MGLSALLFAQAGKNTASRILVESQNVVFFNPGTEAFCSFIHNSIF